MDRTAYPDAALSGSVYRISFYLQHKSDEILQTKLGIGFSQFKLMMALEKHPAVEQLTLAKFLGQTEASISRQIQLMRHSQLITVEKDSKDHRRRVVRLTGQGKVLLEEATRALNDVHQQSFSSLSAVEKAEFSSVIEKLTAAICHN
jgi:MarR family transcriptional regulator, temperature-dependent positive regulator of motility